MSPLKAGSEAAFQQQVENLAHLYGWATFHPADNRPVTTARGRVIKQRVTPGFPDLVMVRDGNLIFAELKTQTGRVSSEQHEWLRRLHEVAACSSSIDVYLWRPSDFDAINERLARGRHRLEAA